MIFENIGSKFNNIFQKFKIKSGKITEKDLDEVLGQIRRVLLEADVNIRVAINIVNEIKNNAIDKEIIAGVSSEEMIIKISNDAIKLALGEKNQEEKSSDLKTDNGDKKKKEPIGFFDIQSEERIMLVGLQGSGKTTMAAKLANFINIKKKVNDTGLCSLDFYRPAAINQLKILSNRNGLKFIDINNNLILKNNEKESINDLVIKQAEDYVKSMNSNNLKRYIVDTAGRTSIDSEMMNQLIELKKIIKPTKIILVVDSMIGKSAIDIAKQFHSNLNLTGLIFTKTDSDTKAGAILSIKSLLDLPIYFLSSGEKIDDIDEFYPDRIAQRILGMGDIVSLVEKASNIMDNKDSDELKNKAAKGELDLFDLLDQLKFLKKMGGIPFVSKFLPSDMVNNANISDSKVKHFEAIILSMTKKERKSPKIVMQSSSRKLRIAKGSGTSEKLVHELLMMHSQISKIAQQFAKFDKSSLIDKFKLGNALSGITGSNSSKPENISAINQKNIGKKNKNKNKK